ncbi:MAG: hypothetical protein ACJ8GN_15665 [Longimicrobiaceae bacterium]
MGWLLDVLARFDWWLADVMPVFPLAALPLLAVVSLAARRAMRRRARPSAALALARVWAEMLALTALLFLAAWVLSGVTNPDFPGPYFNLVRFLLPASLMPLAHALRCTLLQLVGRPGGGSPGADTLRRAAWLAFAAVMLVCAHAMGMSFVFPYAGGAFHAMFAYAPGGFLLAAFAAWRTSVLVLGAAALVFPVWIPLPWWMTPPLAVAIGLAHWWRVVRWHSSPQSPHFHHTVVALFVAMPFAILLIAAAGALLRRWVMRTRSAAAA